MRSMSGRKAFRRFLWLLDQLWALGGFALSTAWLAGWMFRDATPLSNWLYLIPSPFIIVFGVLWIFLTLRHRFRMLQIYIFLIVILAFVRILVVDHRWHRQPEIFPPDRIRVVHWNTAHGVLGTESIMRSIVPDNADIIVISEPPRIRDLPDITYYALGMEYIESAAGMSIASHLPLTKPEILPLPNGNAWHCQAQTPAGPVEILAVDLYSRPDLDRMQPLSRIDAWLDQRDDSIPLMMIGDFNTPRDSRAFDLVRDRLRHGYEVAGCDWPYTWPVPAPMYSIDHIWVSDQIEVLGFRLDNTRFSDHKRQIADVRIGQAE